MDYGFHRVISPKGVIPQAALQLDNTPELMSPTEILIRVTLLNLDSTSMKQLRQGAGDVAERILAIVAARGKLHNPATNSGGVLLGEVVARGAGIDPREGPVVGERIIPVVSTSTLPLMLRAVTGISGDQVTVEGEAILFHGMGYARVPADFSVRAALNAIDISSVVPQVFRTVRRGQTVLVLGAGKAGLVAMAAARRSAPDVRVIALDYDEAALERARDMGHADDLIAADATRPEILLRLVEEVTAGRLCDLVLNCVPAADTEAAAILAARRNGTVIFYSMATRFDRAALGTDATNNDVRMLIGNGVAAGQAESVFELLRGEKALKDYFESLSEAAGA